MAHEETRTVKSAERVFDILEFIRDSNGVTVSEVASEFNIAASTAHQYLKTKELHKFIVKEDGEYYIALRFLDYGETARTRRPSYQLAKENVEELANETQERAQFVVMEHGYGVVLYTTSGDRAVKTDITIGRHVYLHATAAGKAILSQLPEEQVLEVVEEHGLPKVTENTITDRNTLLTELDEIRNRSVAQNNQEDTEGLRAVGVPVNQTEDDVIGALSVSGPTDRLKGDMLSETVPDLLLGMANELELKIEYMD